MVLDEKAALETKRLFYCRYFAHACLKSFHFLSMKLKFLLQEKRRNFSEYISRDQNKQVK
jgi:hypothetical protein